jgi:hypothetical protein
VCADREQEDRARVPQAEPAAMSEPAAGAVPGPVHEAIGSPGRPLDASARAYFEPRFGRDFGRVRVHSDGLAHEAAAAVNARAFAAGPHLVFAAGQYAPQTRQGWRLLAHELTHVVQQAGGGAPPPIQRQAFRPRQPEPAKPIKQKPAPPKRGVFGCTDRDIHSRAAQNCLEDGYRLTIRGIGSSHVDCFSHKKKCCLLIETGPGHSVETCDDLSKWGPSHRMDLRDI